MTVNLKHSGYAFDIQGFAFECAMPVVHQFPDSDVVFVTIVTQHLYSTFETAHRKLDTSESIAAHPFRYELRVAGDDPLGCIVHRVELAGERAFPIAGVYKTLHQWERAMAAYCGRPLSDGH